jgi:ribosomal protein S12 methylthiotransferase accessory factor
VLRFYDHILDAPIRGGGYRSASLAQTWARFAPAGKRAGITRIADITGLDTLGIPVATAIRPMGKSLSTQQGKGMTWQAAQVSALMESLETWTAEEHLVPRIRGSANGLAKRHNVVDVHGLARPRGALDLDARWDWVEGFDLVAGEPVLVPAQAVTLDTTGVTPRHPMVFDVSSNGLASGNVLVEAIQHGLCEVIERHAEAAWRRAGGDRRIVLDTIADPDCTTLIDRITRSGARVFVWDLASDIGVCAIGCAIVEDPREPAWRPLGCYQGFGAHLVPEIAITRALTEAAQTRLTYIAGGRDDFFPADYERATNVDVLRALWQRLAQPCDEPVTFDELPAHAPRGLGEALEITVELAVTAGYEQIIVVELTHPKLRVPVAKVIVPGCATDVEALG